MLNKIETQSDQGQVKPSMRLANQNKVLQIELEMKEARRTSKTW